MKDMVRPPMIQTPNGPKIDYGALADDKPLSLNSLVSDGRDTRDPQALGEKLLEMRESLPNTPLAQMYDRHEKYLQDV